MKSIPIVLCLKKELRNPQGFAELEQAASSLGLELVSSGSATLGCRVSEERFREMFGTAAEVVPSRPRGPTDYGTPGGFRSQELAIPNALQPFIESVAVIPPAIRL